MQVEIKVAGQVFTQSEMTMWDLCPQKWFLRYQERLDLIGYVSWPLIFGTAWHIVMETLLKSKGKDTTVPVFRQMKEFEDVVMTSDLEAEIENYQSMLEAMTLAYAEFYKGDYKVYKILDYEKTLTVELEIGGIPIVLAGKRDLKGYFTSKKIGIKDYKTAGQITKSLTEGWMMKFQFMFYLWLDRKCSAPKEQAEEFLIDVMRKPQLRRKENESSVTFFSRIKQDILKRPGDYFLRQPLDLTEHIFQNFEENILYPKLRRIAMLQLHPEITDILALNRNTDACHQFNTQCEYFACCYRGESKQYKIREVKHSEL